MSTVAVVARPGLIKQPGQSPGDSDTVVVSMDAVKEERYSFENTITKHPVEKGVDISDHVRPEPYTLEMDCIISNTPLSSAQKARQVSINGVKLSTTTAKAASALGAQQSLAQTGYDNLLKLRNDGTLVTVFATTGQHHSMAISRLSVNRKASNSDSLEFTIVFQFVRVVDSNQTRVVTSKDKRTPKKVKNGNQATKPETDTDPLRDVADTLKKATWSGALSSYGNAAGTQ